MVKNKSDIGNGSIEYIEIDYSYQNNVCLTFPGHFSSDPNVCLIPVEGIIHEEKVNTYFLEALGSTFKRLEDGYDTFTGCITGIHVNLSYIETCFEEIAQNSERGTVPLIELVQKVLDGIQQSLGGINQFHIKFEENTGKLKIYDYKSRKPGEVLRVPIKTVGLDTITGGSFVLEQSFESRLTNEFSSGIAIAATAGNSVVGENTFIFNYLNQGITDRIIPDKHMELGQTDQTLEEEQSANRKLVVDILDRIYRVDTSSKKLKIKGYTSNDLSILQNISYTYSNYLIDYHIKEKHLEPVFFIPFDLHLKIDGISGIKIFNKFNVTQDLFPKSYRNKVEFIIKDVEHTINLNRWTTKITGLTVPVRPVLTEYRPFNSVPTREKKTLPTPVEVKKEKPVPTPSGNYMRDCIQYLIKSGFNKNEDTLKIAWAVVYRESGGQPWQVNTKSNDGSIDVGLFQINSTKWKSQGLDLNTGKDPQINSDAAYRLSSEGTRWGNWAIKDPDGELRGWGATLPSEIQRDYQKKFDNYLLQWPKYKQQYEQLYGIITYLQ